MNGPVVTEDTDAEAVHTDVRLERLPDSVRISTSGMIHSRALRVRVGTALLYRHKGRRPQPFAYFSGKFPRCAPSPG